VSGNRHRLAVMMLGGLPSCDEHHCWSDGDPAPPECVHGYAERSPQIFLKPDEVRPDWCPLKED